MSLRLTVFAGLMTATAAFAQMAAPTGTVAPAGPGARPQPPAPVPYGAAAPLPPVAPAGPGTPMAPATGDSTAQGTVVQLLLNPNGDADGLLLNDGTQVAFPPHVGESVAQTVKAGDAVQVSGWRAPGVPVLRMQTLTANGRSVTDQPPQPGMGPRGPRARGADSGLSQLSASGRIDRLLYNDRGDVHGVILADRTVVRFPPHVAAAMTTELKAGATVRVQGWGARTAQGTALEATALGGSSGELRPLESGPMPRRPL